MSLWHVFCLCVIYIFFSLIVKFLVASRGNSKKCKKQLQLEVRDISKLLLVTGNRELTLLEALFNVLGDLGLGNDNIINLNVHSININLYFQHIP